jgi:DNA-binding transcriptional MocR family regulator
MRCRSARSPSDSHDGGCDRGESEKDTARLARQQTLVAQGTWFGDSPLAFRLGLAYEPADKLQRGLEAISAALEADPR